MKGLIELELRKKRAALIEQAGTILRNAEKAGRAMDETELRNFENLHSQADALKAQIEAAGKQFTAEAELRERIDNPLKPLAASLPSELREDVPEVFGHDEKGRAVYALGKNQSYRDFLRAGGRLREEYRGLTIGGFVRAALFGPRTEAEKRALSEGTGSAGGYSVPVELLAEVIDKLRAKSTVLQAGARIVPLQTQQTKVLRVSGDVPVAWKAENAGITAGDATFEAVTFTAKTLCALETLSRELFADSLNVDQAVSNSIAGAMAAELDRAALLGDGTNNAPTGLAAISGTGQVSMGTNGAALTDYSPLLDAARTILDANGPMPSAFIMSNRTWANAGKLKDSTGQPMRIPPAVANIPLLSTSKVPINDTQGTANNASRIFCGDFSHMWIGMREELVLEFLRETFAGNLQYGMLAYLRADIQFEHAESFCVVKGVL